MSLAFASAPMSAEQARAESIGYQALAYVGKRLPCRCCAAQPATTSAPPMRTARSRASRSATSARTTPPTTP